MKNDIYKKLCKRLNGIIPPHRLIMDEIRRLAWGADASFYRLTPRLIAVVETESEVQKLLWACTELGVPLTFRAAGTSLCGQAVTDAVLVMLGDGFNGCSIYREGKEVSLGVGLRGEEANQHLKPFGRKIGPDPASLVSARIAGIVANNSSGMSCGVSKNSYHTLRGMRLILGDGTLVDTREPESCNAFLKSHPEITGGLAALSQRVKADPALQKRIEKKFSIKNTCGYSVNALIDFEDPIDILAHLMVGSEGTLGFISQVSLSTEQVLPHQATALIGYETAQKAVEALLILKKLPVAAGELMDRKTLAALETLPELPDELRGLGPTATALLVETRAGDDKSLRAQVERIQEALSQVTAVAEVFFSFDKKECQRFWEIRNGFDPIVFGNAPPGTIVVGEDIAVPVEALADFMADLQILFNKYDYDKEGAIFGHALAGNLHFGLMIDFSHPMEVKRYEAFMEEFVSMVVEDYDGSLKAEHGTGRNIAPFVEREWGAEILGIMKEIKRLFDPTGILNPGVILTEDPKGYLDHLKKIPPVDPEVDPCVECGFCERVCVSHGYTLSARQRMVLLREIERLKQSGENPALLKHLETEFDHFVLDTCAADSLCAQACPSGIDTGKIVKRLRARKTTHFEKKMAQWTAAHTAPVLETLRAGLTLAEPARRALNKAMPVPRARSGRAPWQRKRKNGQAPPRPQVIYFPSCINRTMGDDGKDVPLVQVTHTLLEKAGFQVHYLDDVERYCCGLPYVSKGLTKAANQKAAELKTALLVISHGGNIPVLCDMSPCLLQMKETMGKTLRLYEPIEFTLDFLAPRLSFMPTAETITIHSVCSVKKMGLEKKFLRLARMCAQKVIVTETNCCGFAGDKGVTHPGLNAHGLRHLQKQIPKEVHQGFSTSRTCEMGLTRHGKVPYHSILYLVDQCCQPKFPNKYN